MLCCFLIVHRLREKVIEPWQLIDSLINLTSFFPALAMLSYYFAMKGSSLTSVLARVFRSFDSQLTCIVACTVLFPY
jgi:hypothetical protein